MMKTSVCPGNTEGDNTQMIMHMNISFSYSQTSEKIIKIIFFHNFSDVHLAQTRLSCWFTVLSQAYSSVKDLQPGDLKSSSIMALNTAISHRHHHLKICVLKTSGTGI